jgi:hypothetical protein
MDREVLGRPGHGGTSTAGTVETGPAVNGPSSTAQSSTAQSSTRHTGTARASTSHTGTAHAGTAEPRQRVHPPQQRRGPDSVLVPWQGRPPSGARPPAIRQDAPAGPGRRAVRLRWASPAARQIMLLLGYLAAGVAVTWPRATYLAGSLPATRDAGGYVWGFWWLAHQVTHLGNPWATGYLAAPVGTRLAYHTLMPLPGLVMTPVTLLFGPSASYNVLSVICPGLLCYAMYRAARLWLPGWAGPVAAGAFFGMSSNLTWRSWYELNLALGALFLPLALAAAVRLRRDPGHRRAVVLGLVLGAAVLTDQESAVLAAMVAALVLVPWLVSGSSLARLRVTLLAGLAAVAVAAPQVIAMIGQAAAGGARTPAYVLVHSYAGSGAGLAQMFAPSPRLAGYGMPAVASLYYQGRASQVVTGYGLVLSLLAVVGLVAAWRRPSARRLGLLWLGCSVLALGPVPWLLDRRWTPLARKWDGVRVSQLMPFTWFVRLPGMANFREADRFTELGLVAAALLAGMAVTWLVSHARPALAMPVLAAAVALGALEAGWSGNIASEPWPIGVMPTAMPSLDRPIAADHSRAIVVDVPFGIRGGLPVAGGAFPPETMVLATADGHRLADAYVSRIPAGTLAGIGRQAFYAGLMRAQAGVRANTPADVRAAWHSARRMDVGWVLVWVHNGAVLRFLRETGFRLGYRADGVSVYRPGPAGSGPAGPSEAVGAASSSRPWAASPRTSPRSPAARPARSSSERAASTRAWRDCQACQTWAAIRRPSGVRYSRMYR